MGIPVIGYENFTQQMKGGMCTVYDLKNISNRI